MPSDPIPRMFSLSASKERLPIERAVGLFSMISAHQRSTSASSSSWETTQLTAKARLDALLLDADNLARAERLRVYVTRVLANAPVGIPRDQLEAWSAYVRDQADRIDPQTSGAAGGFDL